MCADLSNTSYVIFVVGVIAAFSLAWGWIIFLQYCAAPVVYVTMVCFFIAWAIFTLLLYVKVSCVVCSADVLCESCSLVF